jgi:hypothetical protein
MLRLHPSSILLTQEETSKVLENPLPTSQSTVSFTSSLPWDHCVTYRRDRQKGKQKAATGNPPDILLSFQDLSLGRNDEDVHLAGNDVNGYSDSKTDSVDGNDEGGFSEAQREDSKEPGMTVAGHDIFLGGGDITSGLQNSPTPPPALSGGTFRPSTDEDFRFVTSWAVYEDSNSVSEIGIKDANESNYLADAEQEFSEAEQEYADVEPPEPNLPLRPLVSRHLDGAVEIDSADQQSVSSIDTDEESLHPLATVTASDSLRLSLPLPLPDSARLLSRIPGTSPTSAGEDSRNDPSHLPSPVWQVRMGTSRSVSPWFASVIARNLEPGVAISADDLGSGSRPPSRRHDDNNEDQSLLRRAMRDTRTPTDFGNTAFIDDGSDDSMSGIQVPSGTLWELEARRKKRQVEAAKRTIR